MKLGRKPRRFDPRIPHFSTLTARPKLAMAPVPPAIDYTVGGPDDYGFMLNNQLGDCTAAGMYHAIQTWTLAAGGFQASAMVTEPDDCPLRLYEAMGYDPRQGAIGYPNPTDTGCVEQDVLTHAVRVGIPVDRQLPGDVALADSAPMHKLSAFFELDHRNQDDVKRAIWDCGGTYIGFDVPSYLMQNLGPVWDYRPGWPTNSDGGHCVWVCGYDSTGLILISWGVKYKMTWNFWQAFVDEAYALVDRAWTEATGLTPCGLSIDELEAQMSAITGTPAA